MDQKILIHDICKKQAPPPKGPKVYELSEAVQRLQTDAVDLSLEDKFALIQELVKKTPLSHQQCNAIKNTVTGKCHNLKASEQQRTVDSRASKCDIQVGTSSSVAATQVPLIVRSDLVVPGAPLAFDIEKIIDKQHRNVAGEFAMVDLNGRLILWCYIIRTDVCRYNTNLTGLNQTKLSMGISESMVRDILNTILKENKLVGAAVHEDLKSIGYFTDNVKLPIGVTTEDIQDFFKDSKNQAIGLAKLATHFTGETFQSGAHSSISDARMTAICYRRMLKLKTTNSRFNCPEFNAYLEENQAALKKAKAEHKFDRCTCGKSTVKTKKKTNDWSGFKDIEFTF